MKKDSGWADLAARQLGVPASRLTAYRKSRKLARMPYNIHPPPDYYPASIEAAEARQRTQAKPNKPSTDLHGLGKGDGGVVAARLFEAERLDPQLGAVRHAQPRLFQQRTGAGDLHPAAVDRG